MLGTGLKSMLGFAPLILGGLIAGETADDSKFFEIGGPIAAASIFYGLWRQAIHSSKKSWDEVERTRRERDLWRQKYADIRSQCANCPGNAERIRLLYEAAKDES